VLSVIAYLCAAHASADELVPIVDEAAAAADEPAQPAAAAHEPAAAADEPAGGGLELLEPVASPGDSSDGPPELLGPLDPLDAIEALEPLKPVEPLASLDRPRAPLAALEQPREHLAAPTPCPEKGDVVAVIALRHELWLCHEGTAVAKFQVALGRGGIDKRRRGDGRTPLGTYAFGRPRPSSQFGIFIPFDYPTRDQVAQGFTGSEVGIHGPPRGLTEPEYPLTAVDWTRGCIATAMDADIGLIADFVRARQPTLVIR
jgi:hypothetical protein